MNRILKILLSLALCCALLLSTVQVPAQAAESALERISVTHINPLYEDVLTEEDLVQSGVMAVAEADEYHTTPEAAGAAIRDQLEERQTTVVVGLRSKTGSEDVISQFVYDAFDAALVHTGVPTEGDYLKWVFGGWTAGAEGYTFFGTYYITITYTVTYYTNAEQEAELDTAVGTLLNDLDLDQLSDYQKVCAIYDWLCDNITYDSTSTGLLKHTAYAALVNRTAVCQGYAVLLYRLLLEEGIDNRVVVGDSGGPHAWNIIEMDGLYYNADSTWDAGRSTYRYFLCSPDNFSNHTRDADYDTETFHAAYPMGTVNYTPSTCCSCGDANGDGIVNVLDITRIRGLILDGGVTDDALSCGDANGNGALDILDMVLIKQIILAG